MAGDLQCMLCEDSMSNYEELKDHVFAEHGQLGEKVRKVGTAIDLLSTLLSFTFVDLLFSVREYI